MGKRERQQQLALRRVKRELIRLFMAWGWRTYSPEWKPAMILGLSYIYGNEPDSLAVVSGYDVESCRAVIAQSRKAGIWRGDRIRCRAWEKEHSEFSFLLDAMVVGGFISRKTRTAEQEKLAADKRAKRIAEGKCSNCGKPNISTRRTCDACRAAVKASIAKRKEAKPREPLTAFAPKVVDTDGLYYLNDQQRNEVAKLGKK